VAVLCRNRVVHRSPLPLVNNKGGVAKTTTEWGRLFGGKRTSLVLDADAAGEQGVRDIALKFDRASLPIPRQVLLPPGQDLNDFFQWEGLEE